ncbi:MAG: DUF58 domain-containing protein, partial [Candidatus Eremiobacterota bacterium]
LCYDEEGWVTLHLDNRSGRALRLTVRDEVPDALAAPLQVFRLKLPPGARGTVHYRVRPCRRGTFAYGDVLVRLRHGLDLIERDLRLAVPDSVRVYPRFRGFSNYELLARLAERDEARRPRRTRGQGSDYESLRPYVPGDDPRWIDWKSTARRGHLISRNPQVERGQQLALLIDCGRLMAGSIQGHPRLEHAMQAAVRLSYVVQKRGDTLALAAFSNKIEAFVPRLKGPEIMPSVLEALCGVEQRPVESDYWRVTAQILGQLRRRSLVVLFTEVLDAAASQGLLNNLRRAASRHLVLCVVMTERRLHAAAVSSPSSELDAWRQAAACDLLRRRRLALEHMRACGILVLECSPEHLSNRLIRRYLEIRQEDLQ